MSYLNGNKFSLSENSGFSSLSTFDLKPSITDSNYILVKLTSPLDRSKKQILSKLHIQVQQFLGDNTFKCRYEPTDIDRIREQDFIENAEVLSPLLKLPPSLKTQSNYESHDEPKSVDLILHQAADKSAEILMQEISQITGISPRNMSVRADSSIIRAQISPRDLLEVAKIDSVGAIEEVHSLTLLNNVARDVIHADIGDSGVGSLACYKGKGQVVTVADTGFDMGDKANTHPAFANRVRDLIPIGREKLTSDTNGHGTHVCGSVLGNGKSDAMGGSIQGAAPEATLVVQALLADNGRLFGSSGKTLGDLLRDAYENHESRIHTNSWGPQWDWRGQLPYNNASEEIDNFVWGHQDLVVCFAAGNSGKAATRKGHIGAQPAAKNCITVGSCENLRSSQDYTCEVYDAKGLVKGNPDNISGFSSRGPTMEGRIKPDIVAPGGMILSTASRACQLSSTFGNSDDKLWQFSQAAILALQSIQLFADTHDQGWVDDRALGNWTWLEVAIYENESSDSPRQREGVELVWMSHKNDMGSAEYGWLSSDVFAGKHDLLALLEVGNVIAVRVCARFTGWELYGRAACLVLDMGRPTSVEQPPSYAQVMEDTIALQQILNCVNSSNNAYAPTITAAWDRADTFSGKEKRPLRVLSLDGGGVRGYSSLMLLKEVMDKGAPNKKPCEIFDLIGGTSTGGLIAIMLGRLKMTVQECLDEYSALMNEVFGSGWVHDHVTKPARYTATGAFYSAKTLEKVIKALLRKRLPAGEDADNALLLDDKENSCKIFLMAVREEAGNNRGPVFLRSYTNDLEVPDADLANIKLWQAARATSAAPAYFKPLEVGRVKLVDGGLLANNPLGWLWTEVLGVYGPTRETDCFLSIGTGMASNVAVAQPGFNFKAAMMSFVSVATNTESTHLLFRYLVDAFAPCPQIKKYWRLNVAKEKEGSDPKDYESPGELDDVAGIKKLKAWTNEWIAAQQDIIKPCSEAIGRNLLKST